jgi:hypothetical protein
VTVAILSLLLGKLELDWWVRETAAAFPEPTTPSSPRKPWGSRPTGASACRGSRWTAYSTVPDAKQFTPCCRHQHVLRETSISAGQGRLVSPPTRSATSPPNLPPRRLPPGQLPHGRGWNPRRRRPCCHRAPPPNHGHSNWPAGGSSYPTVFHGSSLPSLHLPPPCLPTPPRAI